MDTPCCVCEILIAGRRPQFMQCVSCSLHFHRQCMPHAITSNDYVRTKRNNKAFNFRCVKCVGGVIVSAPGSQQPQPKKQRGRPRKNPLPATLPEAQVRPTSLAIAAASLPDTSSPMDIDGPGLLPLGVSPIDAVPVTITVEARVAVTFTITPVGDASSRFEIPVPLAEDTAELRQPIAIQDVDNRDDDLESSDDDEPVWHIKEKAMKNEHKTLFDGVGHSYHVKRTNKRSVTWRCNKHTTPNFCRSWVSQCDANFTIKVPHTCPANMDISRDASIIMKAKTQAINNPLVSARAVVEKEMMVEFAKNPSRNLPVKDNLIRAVQRKKQTKFPENPVDLHFDWGTPRLVSVIGAHHFSTSINQQFDEAQKRLQSLKASPGNEAKLKLYGLFKQATVGKVNTKRPGMTDFVGKAKWDAWNSLNSLSQEEAKNKYIEFVNSLVGPENSAESSAAPKSAAAGFEVSMDGKLRIITINKPAKKNAFSLEMYSDFAKLLKDAVEDPNTTLVAVTGAGNMFSSGNDLSNFTSFSGSISEAAEQGRRSLNTFVNSLIDFPKPIIGVVNGPALGIACTILGLMDAVYATDRGWFQTPFSALGQSPEACSSYTFPKLMGSLKANEMLLFNKKITAVEACKLGLVTEVFQDANFQSEVWPKIKEWSELPINSLVYSKQLSRQFDTELLHKVNDAECERLLERWQSEDCMEAIMKFFSKNSK